MYFYIFLLQHSFKVGLLQGKVVSEHLQYQDATVEEEGEFDEEEEAGKAA